MCSLAPLLPLPRERRLTSQRLPATKVGDEPRACPEEAMPAAPAGKLRAALLGALLYAHGVLLSQAGGSAPAIVPGPSPFSRGAKPGAAPLGAAPLAPPPGQEARSLPGGGGGARSLGALRARRPGVGLGRAPTSPAWPTAGSGGAGREWEESLSGPGRSDQARPRPPAVRFSPSAHRFEEQPLRLLSLALCAPLPTFQGGPAEWDWKCSQGVCALCGGRRQILLGQDRLRWLLEALLCF